MKKILLLLLTINCSLFAVQAQDYHKIDSLKKVLNTLPALNGTEQDTMRMGTIIDIGILFMNDKPDSAFIWFSSIADTVFLEDKIKSTPRKSYFNAKGLRSAGLSSKNKGEYNKALYYYNKSLKIFELLNNKKGISSCLDNISVIYKFQGEFLKAIEYCKKSLKMEEESDNKLGIVSCQNNLGNIYASRGDYQTATSCFEIGLSIATEINDQQCVSYCLNNFGNIYESKGKFSEAIEYFEKSMAIAEKINDKHAVSYGFINIGLIFKNQGNYFQAMNYFERGLKLAEEIGDKQVISYCFDNFGLVYKSQGNLYKASIYYKKSLKLEEELGSVTGILICLNHLGNVCSIQGDFPQAKTYYERSLKIAYKLDDKQNISKCLNNLGNLYKSLGNDVYAIACYEKSKNIFEQIGNQTGIAACLNNLGMIYDEKGNYNKAEAYFEEGLKSTKEIGEKQGIFNCLTNLGTINSKQCHFAEASNFFQKALDIAEETGDQVGIAASTINKGNVYYMQDNYSKAIDYYQKAIKIFEELGLFAELSDDYSTLASIYTKQKNYNQAASLYLKSVRMKRKLIQDNFSILTEKEKVLFLEKTGTIYNTLNEFADITKADSLVKQCYDNTLLLKGLLLQSSRGIADAVNKSNDTTFINIYWHFKKLRNDIADLVSTPIDERKINLDSLEYVANKEERKLVILSKDFSEIKKQYNYKWENVQSALKKNEAAIEFVKINCELLLKQTPVKIDTIKNSKGIRDSITFSKEKNDSTFYAAFIVRPGYKSPKMISLFDEKELEKVLNKMTNNRGVQILDQPVTKEKSRGLYDLIWAPLEADLKGVKTIYYSPDGLLYKVSFAAMTNQENKFLFDIYNLKTLNSTRELFSQNKPLQTNSDFTCNIYGGIQYDLDASKLITNAKKYKPDEKFDLALNEKEKSTKIKRGGEWNYLNGTLVEAETIKKEFENQKVTTNLFAGENANEESFKSLSSKSPTIIHIATHGFYIADNKSKTTDLGAGNNFKFNKNPLFRSGLVMAGANRVWLGNDAIDGVDDGILTSFEVSNLDLSHTKLVVLSACETGLGEIRGSEGVYGLQRAFKMAGVRYMITSLWEIQDQVTVEFMGTFYKQWLNGKDIYAAFKFAQDVMRKKYEANYWAAFVLVE